MFSQKIKSSGFTLIEITIAITIIVILFWISVFPYGFYMQRSYTERAADWLGQEWILAHKAVRSGIEFDPLTGKHAHMLIVFEKWKSTIQSYLLSGSTLSNLNSLPNNPNQIIKYKEFIMENGVEILGFTGAIPSNTNTLGYIISPPYGDWLFFTGSTWNPLDNARIIVGYPGAASSWGRSREVLLRTYLK